MTTFGVNVLINRIVDQYIVNIFGKVSFQQVFCFQNRNATRHHTTNIVDTYGKKRGFPSFFDMFLICF